MLKVYVNELCMNKNNFLLKCFNEIVEIIGVFIYILIGDYELINKNLEG